MKNINEKISNIQQKFHQFLLEPDQADFGEVVELCKKYPYSQTLWFLQARLSVARNEPGAKEVYQKAALFCTDPEELRAYVYTTRAEKKELEYIETEDFKPTRAVRTALDDSAEKVLEGASETKISDTTDLISKEIQDAKRDESKPSRYMDDWMPYSYVWWLQKTRMEYADTYQPYASGFAKNDKNQNASQESTSNPLDQQIREHIFHLQAPEEKLSEQFGGKAKPFQVPRKENPVIEKFIKEEPQIKPPTAEKINLENKARKSAEDDSGFVSETLAQIYTEQGLYHKALDTYKKLSLKYPEKSLYFAKLIEELNQKLN